MHIYIYIYIYINYIIYEDSVHTRRMAFSEKLVRVRFRICRRAVLHLSCLQRVSVFRFSWVSPPPSRSPRPPLRSAGAADSWPIITIHTISCITAIIIIILLSLSSSLLLLLVLVVVVVVVVEVEVVVVVVVLLLLLLLLLLASPAREHEPRAAP